MVGQGQGPTVVGELCLVVFDTCYSCLKIFCCLSECFTISTWEMPAD